MRLEKTVIRSQKKFPMFHQVEARNSSVLIARDRFECFFLLWLCSLVGSISSRFASTTLVRWEEDDTWAGIPASPVYIEGAQAPFPNSGW